MGWGKGCVKVQLAEGHVIMMFYLTENCTAGYRLDTTTNRCVICPKGSYQEFMWQTICDDCGPDRTTENVGATHPDLCICKLKISHVMRKPAFGGGPTTSDNNRTVQPQKMVGGLKFRIWEVEGVYYLYSENKVADHSYCAADVCLCFRICKKQVF